MLVHMIKKSALWACVCAVSLQAYGAGLYLAPRGVRALSRGGAFVAGADDVNALSYNPAGLADAAPSVLVDASLPLHSTRYNRRVYGDSPLMGSVTGSGLGVPSPTIGMTLGQPWVKGLKWGASLAADVPLLQNWPVSQKGTASSQRYAIGNYDGTMISKASLGAAYRLNSYVSFGVSGHLLVGTFGSQSTLSGCDGVTCVHSEDPTNDTQIQMKTHALWVPGVQVGMNITPVSWLRVGVAWESAYQINAPTTYRIKLSQADTFRDASLSPSEPEGKVSFTLPMQVRAGVEGRLGQVARVEGAFVWENWKAHDRISVDVGSSTQLNNVVPLGTYVLKPMDIQRGFRNTWSVRLGGEWMPLLAGQRPLSVRAGVMYEPSAVPSSMLTAMAVDLDKVIGSLGAAYQWRKFVFEATYAHVFMMDRNVTSSTVFQNNPTRPDWTGRTPVGNGEYSSRADVVGLGVRMLL
jgi:long-chain fatty acid transport protein